jgi:hypothetical protein
MCCGCGLVRRATGIAAGNNAMLMPYPDDLLDSVAVVISHVVTTLSRQVAKGARDGELSARRTAGRGGMGR